MAAMPTIDDLEQFLDLFPPNDGIFYRINDVWGWSLPEWVGIGMRTLDEMCFTQFGYRNVSLAVHRYKEQFPDDNAWKIKVADAIYGMYHHKWDKMLAAAELEYDPIHNFSDTIHEEIVGTEDESTATDTTKTGLKVDVRDLTSSRLTVNSGQQNDTGTQTDTRTDNLTERIDRDVTVDYDDHNQNNLYGFNSTDVVGDSTSGEQSETHTVDGQSKVNTGTQTNQRTDNLQKVTTDTQNLSQHDGGQDRVDSTDTEDRDEVRDLDTTRVRDMTRTGNIGNLSTQNLIQQEIDLWRWNFIQEMIDDAKGFATLPIYVD